MSWIFAFEKNYAIWKKGLLVHNQIINKLFSYGTRDEAIWESNVLVVKIALIDKHRIFTQSNKLLQRFDWVMKQDLAIVSTHKFFPDEAHESIPRESVSSDFGFCSCSYPVTQKYFMLWTLSVFFALHLKLATTLHALVANWERFLLRMQLTNFYGFHACDREAFFLLGKNVKFLLLNFHLHRYFCLNAIDETIFLKTYLRNRYF